MSRLSSGDSGNGSAPYPSGKKKRQLVSFSPESTSIWAALASTLELSKKIPGNRSQLQRIVPDHDKILRFLNLLKDLHFDPKDPQQAALLKLLQPQNRSED